MKHTYGTAVIEIMAAVMEQPRSEADLIDYTGHAAGTVTTSLRRLHERGIVRRAGHAPRQYDEDGNRLSGRPTVLWAAQSKPFAVADEV